MVIDLRLEDLGGGKIVAHAQVNKDDDTPQKGVSVVFTKNGRAAGGQCRVDDDGKATKEFTLAVGTRATVIATVAGKPHVTTTESITPERAKRRATNWVEWLISGIFLILLLKYSYTTFTVVGLIVTIGVLLIGAGLEDDHEGFGHALWLKISNNNWVYYTVLWLFVTSLVIWLFSFVGAPLPELNPVKWAWGSIKDAVMPPPIDPWANDGFGRSITRFFLGDEGGWGGATFLYMLLTPLARLVSFWDDWVARHKANKEKDGGKSGSLLGGAIKFLLGDLAGSEIWKFLGFKF